MIELSESLFSITIKKQSGQSVSFKVSNIWWESSTLLKVQIIEAQLTGKN